MTLHITYTDPQYEVFRLDDGERHCFRCRTRRRFEHVRAAPIGMSWYGPNDRIACSVCGTTDGDLFPGGAREWGDA